MFWIYDIPTWLMFVIIVGGFSVLGVAGLFLTQRPVAWVVGEAPNHNEGVDVFIGAVGVLYGLIAVSSRSPFGSSTRRSMRA